MERDPNRWTTDQVGIWLSEIGFSKYKKLFCEEHLIDGQILLQLTESDLKQPPVCMGILGDIKKIIGEVDLLKHHVETRPSGSHMGTNTLRCDNYKRKNCNMSQTSTSQVFCGRPVVTEFNDLNSSFGDSQSCVSTNLEPEFIKLFVATFYLLFVLLLTTYTMVVVHDWVPNMDKYPPLPDIALDKIPYIPWAFEACEITTLIMGVILFIILVFHKHRFIVIRRLFALSGTVFVLRCITMMITSLSVPGSHLQCEPRPLSDFATRMEMALKIYSGFGMSIKGVRTCGDYMFSGHTVVVTMFNFFITEYTPRKLYWLHIFSWVANFFAVFFILAAHEHYSIDVFVAFYITTRLFLYYHSLANNRVLSQKDSRTRIWFPMFAFFESSLNGIVPNVYELPWITIGSYLLKKMKQFQESCKKLTKQNDCSPFKEFGNNIPEMNGTIKPNQLSIRHRKH